MIDRFVRYARSRAATLSGAPDPALDRFVGFFVHPQQSNQPRARAAESAL
jgi:hypothetical protein